MMSALISVESAMPMRCLSRRVLAPNRNTYRPRAGSVPLISESRPGGVGGWPNTTSGRTTVSVSAAAGGGGGLVVVGVVVAVVCAPAVVAATSLWTGAGAAWRSGVALFAVASCAPVQASVDAAAAAVIARVIFWKCMLLLYG